MLATLARLWRGLGGRPARDLNEQGIAAWARGDLAAAESSFRDALARRARFAGAASNLGMVLVERRRFDEGLAYLRQAVGLDPRHVGARVNLGNVLHLGGDLEGALRELGAALESEPGSALAHANIVRPLMEACDWSGVARELDYIAALAAADGAVDWADRLAPFTALLLPLAPELQLAVARAYARRVGAEISGQPRPQWRAPADAARLRIGYVSCDFHNHATAHLTAGLYGAHDRARVEVFAYSFGPDDGSEYRRRIVAGCDRFVDVSAEPPAATAARIAADGIHILVDLKGYTGGARPHIFALRPAPIQVNFLGYPGSMGAPFIDYIVADRQLVAPGEEGRYDEAVVRMPGSYQANDSAQPIAQAAPGRAACGLPQDAFVFCCFNHTFKIEADVFASWMRLLAAVPGAVLWLMRSNPLAERNLRAAAARAGIDPARLVFAPVVPKPEHLARHRHAGLFLDTGTYNAHTTGSDALWAGVPIVTRKGAAFPARVGASLLAAAGLPELVCADLAAYERLALALAQDAARLGQVRAKLAERRLRAPLFDTAGFARALEAAYAEMWRRHAGGRAPAAIDL